MLPIFFQMNSSENMWNAEYKDKKDVMNKKMIAFILENAQKIEELRTAVNDTFRHKNESSQAEQAWQDATKKFHNAYDWLAFPSGLEKGLELLKKHYPSTIDTAINYLYANPYFFRSGYIQQKIAHYLKSASLSTKQIIDLHETFIAHLTEDKTAHRREYYQLARTIANDEFRKKIENIIDTTADEEIIKRARYLLTQLNTKI